MISAATTVDSRCVNQSVLDSHKVPGHPAAFYPVGSGEWDHPVILVQNGVCKALVQRKDLWALGAAVFIVAHERQHALGEPNEDKADCGAAKTFFQVAAMLGVHGQAARLAAQAARPNMGYHPKKTMGCWTAASKVSTLVITITTKGK